MKLIPTRARMVAAKSSQGILAAAKSSRGILAVAAIAAGLLSGCGHSDSNSAKPDNTVKPAAQSSAPYNPQAVDHSKIPSQFPDQSRAATGASGAPQPH